MMSLGSDLNQPTSSANVFKALVTSPPYGQEIETEDTMGQAARQLL
jgi:hypothetical protein